MRYKGYLIDLDGTMYRGETAIEGAVEFVDYLRHEQMPHLFVTNNSSTPKKSVAAKLNRLGIHAVSEQIVTSGDAAADYIKGSKSSATVYVIGEQGLNDAVLERGCTISETEADYVLVGIDRSFTYEKMATASLLIQNGAEFVSTNKDPAIPNEKGMLPGNGALTASIEKASGRVPLYIGKPEPAIMQAALDLLGLEANEVIMIGDNYLTDIAAGIQLNMDTLMVLTGYSSIDDLKNYDRKPTYIYNNLLEWVEKMKKINSLD